LGYQRNSNDLADFWWLLLKQDMDESRCSHNYTRKRSLSFIALRSILGDIFQKKIFKFKKRKVKRHGIKAQPKEGNKRQSVAILRGSVNLTRGEHQHRRDSMDGQDLVSARGEGVFNEQAVRLRESRRFREYEINGRIKIQRSKEKDRTDKISVPRHRSKQEKLRRQV